MKVKVFIIAAIAFLIACNLTQEKSEFISNNPDSIRTDRSNTDFKFSRRELFKGTLICADCPGIATEIEFKNDRLLYYATNTYLERNVTMNSTGSYTTDRGYKNDENATVYVLDDDKPGHERRFLRLNDTTLLMLGADGEFIDTTSFFKLYKVK